MFTSFTLGLGCCDTQLAPSGSSASCSTAAINSVGVARATGWAAENPAATSNRAASLGKPGRVEHVETYSLNPGDSRIYMKGDVHSPKRESSTKLIRLEGVNMDAVKRDWYEAAE